MNRTLAQSLTIPGQGDQPAQITGFTTLTFNNLGTLLSRAIPFILAAAGIGLLLMIISAGFSLVTSAGDTKKTEAGKQRLTYAIAGFIVIFAAYWLVQLAGRMFAIPEIETTFPGR